ncbi:MAG: hypothetical protein IH901_08030 [Proteobacteria bacterium]|nr:hypothetical protein [Pseudomonadota bacterium]
MKSEPIKYPCFFCDAKCQMEAGVYELRRLGNYGVSVCTICYEGSWDGIAPVYQDKLIAFLKENGKKVPERNEKGWLPRECKVENA